MSQALAAEQLHVPYLSNRAEHLNATNDRSCKIPVPSPRLNFQIPRLNFHLPLLVSTYSISICLLCGFQSSHQSTILVFTNITYCSLHTYHFHHTSSLQSYHSRSNTLKFQELCKRARGGRPRKSKMPEVSTFFNMSTSYRHVILRYFGQRVQLSTAIRIDGS